MKPNSFMSSKKKESNNKKVEGRTLMSDLPSTFLQEN